MGHRKIPTIHTLEFEGEYEGLVVRAKSIKFGKIRRLIALMDEEDKDVQLMGEIVEYLVDAIVSWNLQTEEGEDIEVTEEAIDDLEFNEVMLIVNGWLDAMTGPGKSLGKDSPSGEKFPGQPVTMEAL